MSRSAVHEAAHEGGGERAMSSDIAMQMSSKKRVNLALKNNGTQESVRSIPNALLSAFRKNYSTFLHRQHGRGTARGLYLAARIVAVVISVQSSGCPCL